MKVKKMMEAKAEYERLEGLIQNIEQAIKDFNKQETKSNNVIYLSGVTSLAGWTIATTDNTITQTVNVYLNENVSKLLKPELLALLTTKLAELKKEQEGLEIN